MVLALQSYTGFSRFSAESAIPNVVVLSITRELAPVLAGLMVAGRAGAAIAAEIGTMKVTEQIDALRTLSTNPYNYLIIPRLLAGIISLPILVFIGDIIGVLGGYLICTQVLNFNPVVYLQNTYNFVEFIDVFSGLVKACVFGFIITLMGCYYGFNAKGGAQGVGMSTTYSVVSSSILILFEYIYFSRPDSILQGRNVYEVRKKIGEELATENSGDKNKIDIVVPIPDSGNASALGYSEKIQKPFEFGIIRNHYTGRTFIQDSTSIRHLSVKLKHNPNLSSFKNKNIALIDDSIVRGTTSIKIVEMLRNCGVKSIHMRIASPPVKFPCFYGIDTPTKEELLASKYSIEKIQNYIGVDSLSFITLNGVYRALGFKKGRNNESPAFTDHYFSGDYPVELIDQESGSFPSQLSLLIEAKK